MTTEWCAMDLSAFCVVDTETTGVGDDDVPVEVAAQRLSDGATYCTLVNPGRPIPPEASAIHGIADGDVADAPGLSEVGQALLSFCRGHILVSHNAAFDRRMLPALADRPWLCSLRLARHLLPGIRHTNVALYEHFGCPSSALRAHRALADVRITAAILPHLLSLARQSWGDCSASALIARANAPVLLERMPFGKYRGQPIRDIPKSYLQWLLNAATNLDADLAYTLKRALMR